MDLLNRDLTQTTRKTLEGGIFIFCLFLMSREVATRLTAGGHVLQRKVNTQDWNFTIGVAASNAFCTFKHFSLEEKKIGIDMM